MMCVRSTTTFPIVILVMYLNQFWQRRCRFAKNWKKKVKRCTLRKKEEEELEALGTVSNQSVRGGRAWESCRC